MHHYNKVSLEYEKQMEEGYQIYAAIRQAYDNLINLENDPLRIQGLLDLRSWLDEDNK